MKIRALVALLATICLFAAACGSDADSTVTGEATPETTADTVAEDVMEDEVPSEPSNEEPVETSTTVEEVADLRIVSVSPTATEMLFAIGAGELVVAVDSFSYFPEEAPVTDLSGFEPNVEAIAGFDPTLVVSSAPIEGLDVVGVENMVLPAAITIDDVYTQIEQLGAATGHVGEAAELVGQMQTDIAAVIDALPARETPLSYYHELDNTLYSVTSSTFIGEVYTMLGLVNAADAADPDGEFFGYPQLNEEFLVTADPDIIFLADTVCCEQTAETVAARPGWDQLQAVQNGNIVELNDDVVSRWGPRLVEFVEVAGAAVADVALVAAS
ncbi:MAG: ABC transporter substrate-binding protein [Acidimicrobiia bacterium]|nr:ABC transporter substrate-binding protein [Acidimicrobiia bacterium]